MGNALQVILTVIQALQATTAVLGQISTMIQTANAGGQDLTDTQLAALDAMVTAAENAVVAFNPNPNS